MTKLNKNSSIEDIREYIDSIIKTGSKNTSQITEKDSSKTEEFDKLKTKVLKYVLYKKRTENEVRQKFSSSDIDQNMLEDVIENLKENGYISDENYIQKAVNEFLTINTLSLKEIKNKLYAKGLNSDIIDTYFSENAEELEQYEINCAKKIILKKQNQIEQEDINAFLYRKGYKKESIKQALDQIDEAT